MSSYGSGVYGGETPPSNAVVVSFTDYVPTPRFDGIPWSTIYVEESTSPDGPWTQIDSFPISPVDVDPSKPASHSFTTSLATLTSGWYRVSFRDTFGSTLLTDPIQNVQATDLDWLPTVSMVARKIMSRTRDKFGNLVGTFTNTTQPTDSQVVQIIGDVALSVADAIGDDIPSGFWDDAQQVTALRAAMQIELDFYPEQINNNRSPYPQLLEEYNMALASLQKALAADDPTTPGVDSAITSNTARWSFPQPMTKLSERW